MQTDQQTTKGQGKPELPQYPETLEQVNEWIDAASASQNRDKRNAFTEKYGVTGGTLESRQAQHSPLPWRTVVETDFEPCAVCSNDGEEMVHLVGGSRSERATNAKLIVRSVNNAEKLAEACKAVLRWADVMNLHGTSSEPACVDMCEAAIAQWEQSQ